MSNQIRIKRSNSVVELSGSVWGTDFSFRRVGGRWFNKAGGRPIDLNFGLFFDRLVGEAPPFSFV